MCNPPEEGKNSKEVVELFRKERNEVFARQRQKLNMLAETLSSVKGVTLNRQKGTIYAYPKLHLSKAAIDAATAQGLQPCEFFCHELLHQSGIVTIPGSSITHPHSIVFGHNNGVYHFRICLLTWDLKDFATMLVALKRFIDTFFQTYS